MKKSISSRAIAKIERALLPEAVRKAAFQLRNARKERFLCPICRYHGPFIDNNHPTGFRKHAKCPECGAMERHRLQYLVMLELSKKIDLSLLSVLHFAPEPFFRDRFCNMFDNYSTADISREDVDYNIDLCNMPFLNDTFDFIYASHVIEHIRDDLDALHEIRRILRPGGIALLPVPIIATKTVEYPQANPHEFNHWRAPGPDYFDKYRSVFSSVVIYCSDDFDRRYQTFAYEDRTVWPTVEMPLRPRMDGEKHIDFVPVCYK